MKNVTRKTVRAVLRASNRGEKSTITAKRLGMTQQQVAAIHSNYAQGRYSWL